MTSIRKLLGLVMAAMLLAVFAVPGMAASSSPKYFYAVFPTLVPNTGPSGNENISVTIYNATPPPGVSTINSLEIVAPAGVTINSVSPGTLASSPCTDCIINNIPGIKSGQSKTFTLNVTVTTSACSSETWGVSANTGNAFPQGDSFVDPHPAAENLVSGVGCSGLLGCAGSGTEKGGTLDPTADLTYGVPGGEPSAWGLIRGPNTGPNDDGSTTCTPVPYVFNFDGNTEASFIADKGGQHIIVEYVLVWNPSPLADGWTQRRASFAWGFPNGVTPVYPADYALGLACVVDDISGASGSPLPTAPNAPPYDTYTITRYQTGQVAQICLAQLGWTSVGGGLVQYWSKVIDADGYVKMP